MMEWNAHIGQHEEPPTGEGITLLPTRTTPPPVDDSLQKEAIEEDLELEKKIEKLKKSAKVTLPESKSIEDYPDPVPLRPAVISGMFRCGHLFMFAGASKTGKSFFLINMALSIATGTKLLDTFQCKKGKVLLLNLEVDEFSFADRIDMVARARGLERSDYADNLVIKNMRGMNVSLGDVTDALIATALEDQLNDPEREPYTAIIIDPIYKLMDGDENSARDVRAFFSLLDKIAANTGASVFFSHHHSKGDQGDKRSQDRASGSGVFARSPDVVCDMISLAMKTETRDAIHNSFLADHWKKLLEDLTPEWDDGLTEQQKDQERIMADHYRTLSGTSTYKMKKLRADFEEEFESFIDDVVPMRLEFTLRDFKPLKPVNVFFSAPIHILDRNNVLATAEPERHIPGLDKTSAADKRRHTLNAFRECVDALIEEKGEASFGDVMTAMGISRNTLKSRLVDLEDVYESTSGKGGRGGKNFIRFREGKNEDGKTCQ